MGEGKRKGGVGESVLVFAECRPRDRLGERDEDLTGEIGTN